MTGSIRKQIKQAFPALVIVLLMIIVAALVSPSFRNAYNLRNIAAQVAVLAVVAIAQCCVLFIGGIDMSVSSIISISTIMMALYSAETIYGIIISIFLQLGLVL